MRLRTGTIAALSCLTAALSSGQSNQPLVDYTQQVHSVFSARCLMCHSQEKRSGGLSLAAYHDVLDGGRAGAAVKPGKASESLLIRRITGETTPRMPLIGPPLTTAEIDTIRLWIDQGARETPASAAAKPKWEAPLALTHPAVPKQVWDAWDTPLDRFVSTYLAAAGVPEPPPVPDALFARRVYLDISGLLPEPHDLQAFLKSKSPDKRQKLIAKLLADNQKYAENWISFWNDLLRNDEGVTYHSETASRKSISQWLSYSLESNRPYDQFVSQLLNPVSPTDPDGFLVGVNWRGVVSASQTPAMQAAQNTAQLFLGINLKCNSCHDSFISRWKLKDAYSLASYFSADEKLELYRCDVAQQQFAQPAFLYPDLSRTPASSAITDRRSTAAAIFTDPRNGRLPRTLVNRIWLRLLGRGLVADPDDMDGEPWNPELLDWLASDFVASGYDMKHLIAAIVSSRTYQMPSVSRQSEQPHQYVFRGPEVRRVTAEQFSDAIAAITGEWHVYEPSPFADPPARKPPATATPAPAPLPAAANSFLAAGAAVTPPVTPPRVEPSVNLSAVPGVYSRDWRVAASSLTRALGRPIRDQVYTTRDDQATTLQALELVNGETLTHWLSRGSRKMLGTLPPEPASLLDKPMKDRSAAAPFDIDISGSKKLWLLVRDAGSYSPERIQAIWGGAELVGSHGVTPLSSLKPLDENGLRNAEVAEGPIKLFRAPAAAQINGGVRVKAPSRLVYDLSGGGYKRLRGIVGFENRELGSDISPQVRFFVFNQEPNMDRLTPVGASAPLPPVHPIKKPAKLVDRVFWYALGRPPSAAERAEAEAALRDQTNPKKPAADGLADLLWAVTMKPEFQLIY